MTETGADLSAPVDCPVCETRMQPEQYGDLCLDRCPSCGGLWFDRAELAGYVRTNERARGLLRAVARIEGGESIRCPRCASPSLEEFRTDRVFLSGCSRCGGFYVGGADLRWLVGPAPDAARPVELGVEGHVLAVIIEVIVELLDGAV